MQHFTAAMQSSLARPIFAPIFLRASIVLFLPYQIQQSMTKKEKFQQLMEQLENVGNELNELLEEDYETHSDIEHALFMLQSATSDLVEVTHFLFEE